MTTSIRGPQPITEERATMYVRPGWAVASAVLLLVAGALNIINGIFAIQQSDFYTNQLMFSNLDTWGWVFVGWGIVQVLAGAFAPSGSDIARITGITVASIACVLWFLLIFASPFAAMLGFGVNLIIIYGLAAVREL